MAGLQLNIYVGIGITWIAAVISMVMRVAARRLTKVNWWYDDWFCIAAFVSLLAFLQHNIHILILHAAFRYGVLRYLDPLYSPALLS